MADYIDRQAALDAINIEREYMTRRQEWGAEHILTHYGYRIIADMPSADVVPVVRCKDCKHWREGTAFSYCDKLYGMGVLDALDYMVAEDDYCSMAERRTGARMDGEEK